MSKVDTDIYIESLKDEDKERYRDVLVESYLQYEQFYPTKEAWQNYVIDIRSSVDNP